MGFSRQEHWSGLPFPSAGDLSDSRIKPSLLHWQEGSLPLSHSGSPSKAYNPTNIRQGTQLSLMWKPQVAFLPEFCLNPSIICQKAKKTIKIFPGRHIQGWREKSKWSFEKFKEIKKADKVLGRKWKNELMIKLLNKILNQENLDPRKQRRPTRKESLKVSQLEIVSAPSTWIF